MALIVCPECKQRLSSAAVSCPHCGFPIANHVKEQEQKEYNEKLLSQIAMFPLSSAQPRAKVCAKCARPYFYNPVSKNNDSPLCECNAPSVEIDISQEEMSDVAGVLTTDADIFERLVFPRNIGDKASQEYKAYVNSLYGQLNRSIALRGESPHEPPAPLMDMVDPSMWKPIERAAPKEPPRNVPTCPVCHSTNLSRISASKSFLKIATFGIAGAGDVGKTWKCNNCGDKF